MPILATAKVAEFTGRLTSIQGISRCQKSTAASVRFMATVGDKARDTGCDSDASELGRDQARGEGQTTGPIAGQEPEERQDGGVVG